jgi:thiamine biosynthesis lipoprotein
MASVLRDLPSVLIDAGGDMVGWGGPWKIVLEDPRDLKRAIGEVVWSERMAVGASSPARRKWRNRHHLVDPIRGEPAHGMLGVFTQASTALWADIYSTTLFVLGFERAQALLPTLDVEAMLVAADGRVFKSDGFNASLFQK